MTFTVDGVEPEAGLTLSHAPPEAAAVKLRAVPVLVTARFWLPDVAPPAAYVKDRLPGVIANEGLPDGAAVTVKVTGMDFGLFDAPDEVIVTLPE